MIFVFFFILGKFYVSSILIMNLNIFKFYVLYNIGKYLIFFFNLNRIFLIIYRYLFIFFMIIYRMYFFKLLKNYGEKCKKNDSFFLNKKYKFLYLFLLKNFDF